MNAQQLVLPHPTSRASAKVNEGRIEFTFNDIEELCAFVAREISLSKKKYSRLAEKADVCPNTVSRMANGKTHHPRAETVFALLGVLGYEVVVRG